MRRLIFHRRNSMTGQMDQPASVFNVVPAVSLRLPPAGYTAPPKNVPVDQTENAMKAEYLRQHPLEKFNRRRSRFSNGRLCRGDLTRNITSASKPMSTSTRGSLKGRVDEPAARARCLRVQDPTLEKQGGRKRDSKHSSKPRGKRLLPPGRQFAAGTGITPAQSAEKPVIRRASGAEPSTAQGRIEVVSPAERSDNTGEPMERRSKGWIRKINGHRFQDLLDYLNKRRPATSARWQRSRWERRRLERRDEITQTTAGLPHR